jgi:hypothetical protein
MEVSGKFHDPAALPSGKQPRYPLDRKLGGLQNRSGRSSEETKSLFLPGLPARSLVTLLTELSRLLDTVYKLSQVVFKQRGDVCCLALHARRQLNTMTSPAPCSRGFVTRYTNDVSIPVSST